MKQYVRCSTDPIDYEELRSDTLNRARSLMRQHPAMSHDAAIIKAAKEIAKEANTKYQNILKLFTPNNSLSGDQSWDSNGNVYRTN